MQCNSLCTGNIIPEPSQTGVLGADQPLYAIAKQLQWTFPGSLGEDKLVVMLGALHVEDKVHQMTGKLLRGSGWTTVLSQAQVLTFVLDHTKVKHCSSRRSSQLTS